MADPPKPSREPYAPKTHRKSDADRRDDRIPVRVTAVQKAMLAEGARRSSVEVSTWLRSLAIRECRILGISEETVQVAVVEPRAVGGEGESGEASEPPARKGRRTPKAP